MTAAERVLDIARREIGVTEYPPGSNKVKYNTWFYGKEVSGDSYPWCCSWVCWVFDQARCLSLLRKTSGCTTLLNWFKAKGLLVPVKDAKPSDIAFYQFDKDAYADHVGIIERTTKIGVVAIEGNTSTTSNDNGGKVMRRTRKWSVIMAVARPDYESLKEEVEMTDKEIKELIAQEVQKAVGEAVAPPKTYYKVEDLPAWAQEPTRRLIEAGIIQGDGKHQVNLTEDDLRTVAMVDKLWAAVAGGEEI